MAEIQIKPEHKQQLSAAQQVLGFLTEQQAQAQVAAQQAYEAFLRAIAALQHIRQLGQREQDELAAFLREHYGVEFADGSQLDAERGVITTPDSEPAPAADDHVLASSVVTVD